MQLPTTDKVLNVLARVTETEEVKCNLDIRLFEVGLLDSLGAVQLMVALSEEFGVEITPAEFDREDWATPHKIIAYMENRLRK